MIVSHFELIYKPQAPKAPEGTSAVDRVIQGYFLEITNLEDKPIQFAVEFVAAAATDPLRSLAGNALVFVDTPDSNNVQGVLSGSQTGTVFRPSTGNIRIPAQGTALVAVLPSAFGPLPGESTPLTSPNFEVRGYVRLRVPAILSLGGSGGIRFVKQSETPVKVLLTPQNRATYFKADGSISDQTQASLPLAQGSAAAEIIAEPGRLVAGPIKVDEILKRPDLPFDGADRAEMLAMLLASIDPETDDVAAFNKALSAAGIGMAIEMRKVKAPK